MKKSFEQWMSQVDAKVEQIAGLSTADLPDAPFMDWFEAGKTPASAAKKVVANAGWDA